MYFSTSQYFPHPSRHHGEALYLGRLRNDGVTFIGDITCQYVYYAPTQRQLNPSPGTKLHCLAFVSGRYRQVSYIHYHAGCCAKSSDVPYNKRSYSHADQV